MIMMMMMAMMMMMVLYPYLSVFHLIPISHLTIVPQCYTTSLSSLGHKRVASPPAEMAFAFSSKRRLRPR
jgi:hypothetical protein